MVDRSKWSPWLIFLAAILLAAFGVRSAAAWWWQSRLPTPDSFGFGDSNSYWILARAIARGEPFQYGPDGSSIFRMPGYPLLLAPLFWLAEQPPVMWARVEGAALGMVAVAATIWLGRMLYTPVMGCWAGVTAAIYPGAIGTSIFVLSEAPYSPLLALQLACWVSAWRAAAWQSLSVWSILAGLAGGAATLVRPSHLLFTPFALAMAMISGDRRRNIVIGAIMLASLGAAMLPWWVRNYRITGRFVGTTLQLGASLYDGLNPDATGGSDMRFVPDFVEAQRRADAEGTTAPVGTFEERLDARLLTAATKWAASHPGRVALLVVKKFFRMWSPLPNAAEFQSWLFRLTILLSYTPLIVCAVYGAWRHFDRGWPYVLCVLPAVYLTLLHVVFVSSIRYREPAMLPLIVLAAGCWHRAQPKAGG